MEFKENLNVSEELDIFSKKYIFDLFGEEKSD